MGSVADRGDSRITIELDAVAQFPGGRSWPCVIRDFCGDGMLLEGATTEGSHIRTQVEDEVLVLFSVPVGGQGSQTYRLTAVVKRATDNALGVHLRGGMALGAFRALEDHARKQGAPGPQGGAGDGAVDAGRGRIDQAVSNDVVARVHRLAARALPSLYKAFFDRAAEELIVLARDAGSNARQSALLEALNVVEAGAKEVTRAAGSQVLDHIANPRTRSILVDKRKKGEEADAADALTLVDTNAFEDWLAVADIIAKAEDRFVDDLTTLCAQMGMLRARWAAREIMPLGPAVLAATFDDAMQALELDREIRRLFCSFFQESLISFLRRLIPALQKLLDDCGALPRTEELSDQAWRTAGAGVPANHPRRRPEGKQPSDAVDRAARAGPGSTQETAAFNPNETGGWGPGQVSPARSAPPTTRETGSIVPAAVDAVESGADTPVGAMLSAARTLMHFSRDLAASDDLPGEMPLAREAPPASGSLYSADEVRAALTQLRSGPALHTSADFGVQRRLAEVLPEGRDGRQFAPDAHDALEMVDGLFDSIRSDAFMPESLKPWLGDLEAIYGQLATQKVDLPNTSQARLSPALHLLNELAELAGFADAGEGFDPALRDQVDSVMAGVRGEFDGDEAVFERAVEVIRPILDRQRRTFDGNLRRVVRQSEGSSRLLEARCAVVDAVAKRLGGRDVPRVVVRLLNPGWRNLLVHTHLRHGPGSSEFLRQLVLVDELIEHFDTGDGGADGLIEEIADGLKEIAYEPGRRSQLLSALRDALGQTTVDRIHVGEGRAAEVLGLEHALAEAESEQETDADASATNAEWNRCLGIARALEVGAWVRLGDDAGRSHILMVAWIGGDHAAFTLVNRKGVKVLDMSLREVVQRLVDDAIEILGDHGPPLVERASQHMLQKMHNQLAYQAMHDALTGLINRKEFERVVAAAVRARRADECHGLLIFMDLDQFKVINNTCGHDAGDELLRTLVPSLRQELLAVHGQLARLGGDEFGILVERCDGAQAQAVTDGLLRSVREFGFDWQGERYALTASLGCVPFGDDGRDAVDLLKQADAACYAAKDAGRNRVQVFQIDDEQMAERRGVMEWVARVDQVLREGRIRLTAQKIAPLGGRAGAKPHYEILMTVLNERGEPMPPVDFIAAAEGYDRMPAVDRWVVEHALRWMSVNLEHMDRVHGFSINLSGRSLNDPDFRSFVVKQLELTRVPTEKVTFEITETAAFSSVDAANRFITHLKNLGCTFSLDDFGTGLASYSYLRNLNVDYVKIDGMFVRDLIDSPADYAVVKSVTEIARFMGKQTIAECVETKQILEALREIGVDYVQGWGVERAKPLDEIF